MFIQKRSLNPDDKVAIGPVVFILHLKTVIYLLKKTKPLAWVILKLYNIAGHQ